MTTLYLIRHGQASFGTANYDRLSSLHALQALGKEIPRESLPAVNEYDLSGLLNACWLQLVKKNPSLETG